MTLLRHLVAADVRRFGWLIAAWIALVGAGVVAYARLPVVAGVSTWWPMASGILWMARQVYRLVLIATIVHAHPAVGSTAFWMTRPIPPRLLILSKALIIGAVTVGAPVLGDLALAVAYSVPIGPMVMSALQTAAVNGVWVALCLTIAVVTRSLAQFALMSGVAASGIGLGALALQFLVFARRNSAVMRSDDAFSPVLAGIAAVVFVAFLAFAWAVQYTRRRRPQTIVVSASGACLALALVAIPPPAFIVPELATPAWARGAVLRLDPGAGAPYDWGAERLRDGKRYAVVKGTVTLPALPPSWTAYVALRDATIQTDTGVVDCRAPISAQGTWLSGASARPMHDLLTGVLQVDYLFGGYYGRDSATLFITPAEASPRTSLRGRYRGDFHAVFSHAELAGVLALEMGATFQDGSYRLVIREVRHDGPLTLLVQQSDVTRFWASGGNVQYEFYLRSRTQREALVGNGRPAREFSVVPGALTLTEFSTTAPGVWTSAMYLTYQGSPSMSRPGWDLTPEWVSEAELVVVRMTTTGPFEVPLEVDDLAVAPSRLTTRR